MCVLAADAGETALRAAPCLGWTVASAPHMREEMAHPPRGSRERKGWEALGLPRLELLCRLQERKGGPDGLLAGSLLYQL